MGLRVSSVFLSVLLLAGTTFQTGLRGLDRCANGFRLRASRAGGGAFLAAARLLRAEGAENGSPDDILFLAKAEAGWENWAAVAALLSGVNWLGKRAGAKASSY